MGGGEGIYLLYHLTRGMTYVIIPPILWKVNNILPYLYKYSDKIKFLIILAKFLSKISPKMQKFGQSGAKNCVFYPSPALNMCLKVFIKLHDFSCKNTKFSSFWRGHIPPQTLPCVCKHAIGADMPPDCIGCLFVSLFAAWIDLKMMILTCFRLIPSHIELSINKCLLKGYKTRV